MNKLDREKLLFRYTNAIERGDFTTVEAILREAQHDAELERMIEEVNRALSQDLPPSRSANTSVISAISAASAASNHRYNHKDNTMYSNPAFPRAAKLQEMPHRFPYALAAAILAVILVGGLLATTQFGFDNQGDSTNGAALQQGTGTPTMIGNPANPTVGSTATPIIPFDVSPTISALPYMPSVEAPVLCEAQINQPTATTVAQIGLYSRPNGVLVSAIPSGQVVQVLDFVSDVSDPAQSPTNFAWYFVRWSVTQGWLSSEQITLLTTCLPPTTAEIAPTSTPDPAMSTAIAATEQARFNATATPSASGATATVAPQVTATPSAN